MKNQGIIQTFTTLALCAALCGPASAQEQEPQALPELDADQPLVQLAVLLDTSGSMSGLIDQAKTQLWKIVNEFITAKQNGKTPIVQIALYEYGKSRLSKETHWIRQIQPLTRDLDTLSKDLFALTTSGGSEYCGAVIERAVADLKWKSSPNVYKAIFIAGNEPFDQGPVDPKSSCRQAIAKGIIVNTIHCGPEAQGLEGGWKQGALLADGSFLIIDQNKSVAHIEAPQDKEIVKLNQELNRTYISYGKNGKEFLRNQSVQDTNASVNAKKGSITARAVTKATANYDNRNWDLVDASKVNDFKLEDVNEEDLPEELKTLSLEERKKYIAEKAAARGRIQQQILALNKDRNAYVAAKRKGMGKDKTLDTAIAEVVRSQAVKKNFNFE